MSKMKDTLEDTRMWKTVDNYFEHDLHYEYDSHCSTCYSLAVDCKFTDCQGDGKVHDVKSLVDTCEACTAHANSVDTGN